GRFQLLPLADGVGVQARVEGGGDDEALVVGADQRLPQLRREARPPLRIDLMLEDTSKHGDPNLAPRDLLHATVCHFLPLLARVCERGDLWSRNPPAPRDLQTRRGPGGWSVSEAEVDGRSKDCESSASQEAGPGPGADPPGCGAEGGESKSKEGFHEAGDSSRDRAGGGAGPCGLWRAAAGAGEGSGGGGA